MPETRRGPQGPREDTPKRTRCLRGFVVAALATDGWRLAGNGRQLAGTKGELKATEKCPNFRAELTYRPPPPPPCVTFRRVVVSLRGPGQSLVLPFACCVGSLRSVGRCGRCSCWCRFRVRGALSLVYRGCAGCGGGPPTPPPTHTRQEGKPMNQRRTPQSRRYILDDVFDWPKAQRKIWPNLLRGWGVRVWDRPPRRVKPPPQRC